MKSQQSRPIHIPPANPAPAQQEGGAGITTAEAATADSAQLKWEGRATAELPYSPGQVWPLWADFCGFHRWFPLLAASYPVEGSAGGCEVGSVRCCVGRGEEPMWGRERLLEMDHERRVMRYEVVENNVGLRGYVATVRVREVGGGGCEVEWSFEAEAAEGWGEEGLREYVKSSLEAVVKKMEEALIDQ
uniref:Lachrymatory factor synthase n=1 Tax=Kalanchoe fedtschenkoi TaxID=63787 RepID=A0A7N0V869_KALFE